MRCQSQKSIYKEENKKNIVFMIITIKINKW